MYAAKGRNVLQEDLPRGMEAVAGPVVRDDNSMHVFLSYQSRDLEAAQRLAEALRRHQPDVDIFLAPRVLTAGAYWLPRLAEALANADAMLLLVGPHVGPWQELEYYEAQRLSRQADRGGRPLIVPVVMTDQAPGLPFLDLLHRVFAADPAEPQVVEKVLSALAGSKPTGAPPLWSEFSPYKGLPSLTSADAAFFFGRDQLTAEILATLTRHGDRVIALIGASGVGKSSVAQAGVLAALKSQLTPGGECEWPAALADSRRWLQVTIRPGEAPLKELSFAFVRLITDSGFEQDREAAGWAERFEQGATLADLLRVIRSNLQERTHSDISPTFMVYVDQGEEIYSRAPHAQARAFSLLLSEAARQSDVRVLLSIRADYYGALQADAPLFAATRRIDVPPLQTDALELVIRGPAERLGARFDYSEMPAGIAAAAAGEAGALPLLSYLLSDMWRDMQARGDGVLRWLDRPELIDIAAPLRERAERYRKSNESRERVLRRLFTLRLAHVPREGEAVRRRARRSECTAEEWTMAETLASAEWRLLTLNAAEGGSDPTAEVAHEQLLRKWPTLRRWLEQEREFLIWRGEVEPDRLEWLRLPPAERNGALLMGRRLARARQWLAARPDDIDPDDRAFIVASENAELEQRNKALLDEHRLQEANLEAALHRAAASKKVARRTAIGAVGVALGGAVAAGFYKRADDANQRRLRQVDDLRNFWARQESAADTKEVVAGEEETVRVPEGANQGGSPDPKPTWGLEAVGAHRSRYTGRGCVVALLGTGIDAGHESFRGVTLVQKDFSGDGNGDRHGHSTHTAGTIFGRPVEGHRVGVAPGITQVLVAKVLKDTGAGSTSAIRAGLLWALNHPIRADVICAPMGNDQAQSLAARLDGKQADRDVLEALAWGLHEYLEELRFYRSISVLAALVDKGAVLVMPAGNDSVDARRVPVTSSLSAIEGVLSVGAVEPTAGRFKVTDYSNAMPTLCAPGNAVLSARAGGRVEAQSGTSASCAHAAGVAALWWERLRAEHGDDAVTSRMVVEAMLKHARTDVFVAGVQARDRGAGLIQAPLG